MTFKTKLESVFGDNNERAVSPVIGVILMVAITVILAAVIATFVIDLGGDQQSAPQANFGWEGSGGAAVTVTHEGGDVISEDLEVRYEGGTSGDTTETWSSSVDVGSEHTTSENVVAGTTVRIVWTSADGNSEQILAEYTAS